MSNITLTCGQCSKKFDVARLQLSTHWGKKIKVKCRYCQYLNPVEVNSNLMAGIPKFRFDEMPTEHTINVFPAETHIQIAGLLVLENEHNQRQTYKLKKGENIIGRQSDDDSAILNKIRIITDDTKMSRSHCQITVVQKADNTFKYILSDLGSLNGTFIEDIKGSKKLEGKEQLVIQPNDIIGLGFRTKVKLEV